MLGPRFFAGGSTLASPSSSRRLFTAPELARADLLSEGLLDTCGFSASSSPDVAGVSDKSEFFALNIGDPVVTVDGVAVLAVAGDARLAALLVCLAMFCRVKKSLATVVVWKQEDATRLG